VRQFHEYKEWLTGHMKDCPKNFDQAAGAMETGIASVLGTLHAKQTNILCFFSF